MVSRPPKITVATIPNDSLPEDLRRFQKLPRPVPKGVRRCVSGEKDNSRNNSPPAFSQKPAAFCLKARLLFKIAGGLLKLARYAFFKSRRLSGCRSEASYSVFPCLSELFDKSGDRQFREHK
jgi:hypothetical protein